MTMRQHLVIATAVVIGLAASIPAMSQTTQTTETTTTTTVKKGHHNYVYYGDHDIYFAPETKVYYWREGEAWRSGAELPVESRTYVTTGGVKIDLDTERPYERNEWVIEHYKKGHDRDDRDHDH
ncbi:MAG: hypothetical protein ABIS07_07215 [Dokdonella sp.]